MEKYINFIKANLIKIVLYAIILILSYFLFKSCETPVVVSKADKEAIKTLEKDVKKYTKLVEVYKDSIKELQKKKVVIKKELVNSVKSTKEKLKPIPKLSTKGIAVYLQKAYSIPVVITQYGVAVPDTLGKLIITDLIKKEACDEQLTLTNNLLTTEVKENGLKDNVIDNLNNIIDKKDSINNINNTAIKNAEKSLRAVKNKKTFWQVTTGAVVAVITILVIKNKDN